MANNDAQMREKLWKALKDDMTVMLGLTGVDEGHSRPMTAQIDDSRPGTLWFFTARDTALVGAMGTSHRAVAHLPRLQNLLHYICEQGFEHHVAVNPSLTGEVIAEACGKYLGWEMYTHK